MLNGEKRGHQESTSNRLPMQTPGQGIYGKQQSELNPAWALATPQRLFTKAREGLQSLTWDLLREG